MSEGFRRAPSQPATEHRPPRDFLYTKHFMALADYVRDYKSGLIQSYAKLSKDEKKAKFGISIVPIFVPLAPGETPEQYEARFVAWLQRAHGLSLADVQKDPDDKVERVHRIRFAGLNGTGAERFQPEPLPQSGEPASSRSRLRDPRKRREDGGGKSSESHGTARSPLQSRPGSSSHLRQRSLSPARSVSSSGSRGSRDRAPSHSSRDKYYVKKYFELDEYKVGHQKIDECMKLMDAKKTELFGSPIVPIHVPLARGESMQQYEERFVQWLRDEKGFHLKELADHWDHLLERAYRIEFAKLNAKGVVGFKQPTRKRSRSPSEPRSRPEKKAMQENERRTSSDIHSRKPPTGDSTRNKHSSVRSSDHGVMLKPLANMTHGECNFVAPLPDASTSAVTAAYIACGCRQCLVQGMRHLNEKILELDRSSCETSGAVSPEATMARSVVDLTQDDDPHSPRSRSSHFAAAVARLLSAPETAAELQRQVAKDSANGQSQSISDDPVENQLLSEYQTINKRVLRMEMQLSDLAAKLTTTSATDSSEISRLQDESQQIRDIIQKESDDRSAALAMLVVYMWRHSQDDLINKIDNDKVGNVLHTQRTSHKKCSLLSTTITEKRTHVAELKTKIDSTMEHHAALGADDITSHLKVLSKLCEELTTVEGELRGLVNLRRTDISNLIRYDEKLRLLIKTLLTSAS